MESYDFADLRFTSISMFLRLLQEYFYKLVKSYAIGEEEFCRVRQAGLVP